MVTEMVGNMEKDLLDAIGKFNAFRILVKDLSIWIAFG